ncbi:MAG: glutathione S-transferase family protein [Pseudomonadota bacterium]
MIELFGHAFSSYTQKALIALYEKDLPFTFRMLGPEHPENGARLNALWPFGRFPVLVDEAGGVFPEASIVIERIDQIARDPAMLPSDPALRLEARLLDRVFDNDVMNRMQAIVNEALVPEEERHPPNAARARAALDRSYAWLDARMADRRWAVGDAFGLADCAAAPALFYADWAHPIDERFAALRRYRARLLARPSVARTVDEARPYRAYFPLGAPERD